MVTVCMPRSPAVAGPATTATTLTTAMVSRVSLLLSFIALPFLGRVGECWSTRGHTVTSRPDVVLKRG
ncbi:hypothetical protein GCM10009661_31230 [Catellatospora chokoriensis]|uniref:Uncharacterized protein n=1 Tax=Catellatospora chokoriensis TaxID=310353 RepID=A0A8J3JXA4_9ACTN|nr:hypothetical protein Cch02nite_36080 [Catellatospora chokoriensis]